MKTKLASLVVASLVALFLLVIIVWKGIPLAINGVVRLVPVSWEERLGRTVAASLSARACDDPELNSQVQEISERLAKHLPRNSYRFQVKVVENPEVNALAAPGGYIVIFSGLVDRMETPEQLAGVLAHEMQHVVQRHSTRSLTRALGIQIALTLIIGDPGGLTGLAGNLGILHFMRADEQSADEGAVDNLIRARIDPQSMIEGFEKLRRTGPESDLPLKYFSTHPPIEERIAYLKEKSQAWQGRDDPFPFKLSRTCEAAK